MSLNLKINHRNIYFCGLALVVVGLPLSKFLMSFGQLVLVANWLIEGRMISKFRVFFRNKIALVISSLFLLHIIGLIFTIDFDYAFKDLKVKLPLLILPLIISTSEPIDRKRFQTFMLIFIAAVIASTFASIYNLYTMDYLDIREISAFISHIRLSLLICLSVFILLFFIVSSENFTRLQKLFFLLIMLWLIVFLFILESITGLSILLITAFLLVIIEVFKTKNKIIKITLVAGIIIVPVSVFLYVNSIYKEFFLVPVDKEIKLEKFTAHGNPYDHNTLSHEVENGHYVWQYISDMEMRDAWNKRSRIKYDSNDLKGQNLKYTLIRFLTSKGVRKDADGVSKLSDEEVHFVENGIANINCQKKHSLSTRIYEIIWEYENYKLTADPNGHSVTQRLEYWKTSIAIIREHPVFGVGTGDMNLAFARQYEKMNSPLDKKWRFRSHNQFLSITVGFGLFGLLWFLATLIYPFLFKRVRKDYFYFVFFVIAMLSMIAEDTIESQAGLTFFVFFNTLFLIGKKQKGEILS